MKAYEACTLCPRRCGVNRIKQQSGICAQTAQLRIARAALHMWEEPCISGTRGSGTVFFSGCQLRCIFCQNDSIAQGEVGREISVERLTEIFFELEQKGANNINLVTPDHFIPHIVSAIQRAREQGFTLPFVYNTGSYVSLEALRMLDGWIDVYLPDFKYMDSEHARAYSGAADYPEVAKAALAEMFRQVGPVQFATVDGETEPMLVRGMLVRHLLLPGAVADAKRVITYLHRTYGNDIYLSLMNQYTPGARVLEHPLLHRKVRRKEYEAWIDAAIELGIEQAFVQEGSAAEESFIPAFDYEGVEAES